MSPANPTNPLESVLFEVKRTIVGQQQVREDRAELGLELAGVLVIDARPGQVGGHQIGSELDALELPADRRCQ